MLRTPGRFEEIRSIRCIVTDPCPSLGRREEASVRQVADRKEWSQLPDWHLLEVSVQFANDTGCGTIYWMVNTLVRQYLEQLLVSVLGTNDFCSTLLHKLDEVAAVREQLDSQASTRCVRSTKNPMLFTLFLFSCSRHLESQTSMEIEFWAKDSSRGEKEPEVNLKLRWLLGGVLFLQFGSSASMGPTMRRSQILALVLHASMNIKLRKLATGGFLHRAERHRYGSRRFDSMCFRFLSPRQGRGVPSTNSLLTA